MQYPAVVKVVRSEEIDNLIVSANALNVVDVKISNESEYKKSDEMLGMIKKSYKEIDAVKI